MKRLAVFILSALLILSLSACGGTDPGERGTQIKMIYLAGPCFNEAEIANIEYAEAVLEGRGFTLFSPMRHPVGGEVGTTEWSDKIFEMDKRGIEKTDAVVAVYYGNYSDAGTAWECGYAYAIGKPVILVHVDAANDSSLMLHSSCTTNNFLSDLASYDFKTCRSMSTRAP